MKYFAIIILIASIIACNNREFDDLNHTNETETPIWLVDTLKMSGTEIRNSFPIVTNPNYKLISEINYAANKLEVVVFKIENKVFVYPLDLLGVEVINDRLNDTYFAVTYCPKTRTTYVIDRKLNGNVHTFAASGLLYAENLVYYDLETESLWSQMYFKCIHGKHIKRIPNFINSFRTDFETANKYFPDAKFLVGYDNKWKSANNSISESNSDGDLVFGLINYTSPKDEEVAVLNLDELQGTVIKDDRNNMVLHSNAFNFTIAFKKHSHLTFAITGTFPEILIDNEGSTWDIFGVAVEGNRKGQMLEASESYLASWWAWKGIFTSFHFLSED